MGVYGDIVTMGRMELRYHFRYESIPRDQLHTRRTGRQIDLIADCGELHAEFGQEIAEEESLHHVALAPQDRPRAPCLTVQEAHSISTPRPRTPPRGFV